MFLLLAGAGMGKSVFSAVMNERLRAYAAGGGLRREARRPVVLARHFFKVGELRCQARAMLRSIAFQLAELLPGFAEPLREAVAKHGD
eukprot:242803-Chlamydomonas_euryale.AAC.1